MHNRARVALSRSERSTLGRWSREGGAAGRRALRARIVLAVVDGVPDARVAMRLGVHRETVARWRRRFAVNGLEGVSREAPRVGSRRRVVSAIERRIVHATLHSVPEPGTRWTTRSLARSLRVNHMLVHRVWNRHGIVPVAAAGRRAGGPPKVDLRGAFVTAGARAVVFSVGRRRSGTPVQPLPVLNPNPTGNPDFSGPEERAREVVRAVRALGKDTTSVGPRSEAPLLVFLRGVERTTHRSHRLEVVFDRPVARLGRRIARWLSAHGRFRVFTPAPAQRWSDAVDAWVRRWEGTGFDAASWRRAPEFVRRFPPEGANGAVGRLLSVPFTWGPVPQPPGRRLVTPKGPGLPPPPTMAAPPDARSGPADGRGPS